MKTQIMATFFICTLAIATVSAGQETGTNDKGDFFGASLGAKGMFGGNYLNNPIEVPAGALLYDDGAGGIGGGGGFYTEFRILWGHLGLEFDVLFDRSKNWSSIEFNNTVNTDWIYKFTSVRMPLLLKGSVENDQARGSIGFGPEFVVGINTDTDIVVTEGSADGWDDMRSRFTAKKQTDTFLCFNVGAAFKVWKLTITTDIRYSLNLTQPEKYNDRVVWTDPESQEEAEVIASNTMDLRILLGIAYELGF